MTVDYQVGKEQPALPAGEEVLEALAVSFYGEGTAHLDAQRRVLGRQGHANILPVPCRGDRARRFDVQDHPLRVRFRGPRRDR